MSAEQFNAVLPVLSIAPARAAAARMALVDDLPLQAIAEKFGWTSRQTVSDAVSSVWKAWRLFEASPFGEGINLIDSQLLSDQSPSTKRRMSATQFQALRPFLTRMRPEFVEAARLALVEDMPLESISVINGWPSRQTVSDAVTRVYAAWHRYAATKTSADVLAGSPGGVVPVGWESVTLIAPPELIRRFRQDVARALAKAIDEQSVAERCAGSADESS